MATDIEESDTDDHERPAPPKRHCTRLKVNESLWDMEKSSNENEEEAPSEENVEYDDAERYAREKLKRWQACQVAKGYVDNTINKVLENYIMGTPSTYSLEESRFQLFRGNDMEDTAVLMAIRNHGLVQTTGLVSQSNAFYSDKAPGYWTNNDYNGIHCSCPSSSTQEAGSSMATVSSDNLRLNESKSTEEYNNCTDWDLDKAEENNQQENFLERAVAEAIKKKGLSALSVDYG